MKKPFPRLKVLMGIGGCALVLAVWAFESNGDAPQIPDAPTIPASTAVTEAPPPPAGEAAPVPLSSLSTAPTNLSPALAEIGRLAESGVSEEVILAYIATAEFRTAPTVDEILYLNDLGLSDAVITAILARVKELQGAGVIATAPVETNIAMAAASPITYAEPEPATVTEVVQTAPVQQVKVTYFYDSLSPYGSWVNVGDYGLCWRPTVVVVNPRWRPYADRGRWVYTDCGWYWQSDYSWGWAAFHYGRWHQSPSYGWVWVPGSTWGPSWVSWRYSSDYCGWAPLPPEARYDGVGFSYRSSRVGFSFEFGLRDDHYTFVPTRRFCDRDVYRHYVAPSYGRAIYNNTTVNNYYIQQNNTVVNRGIAAETVVKATSRPLTPVAIREAPKAHSRKVDVVDPRSNTLLVHRPSLTPAAVNAKAPLTVSPRHVDHSRVKNPASHAGGVAATPLISSKPQVPPGQAKRIEPTGKHYAPVTSPRAIENVKPTQSIQPVNSHPNTRVETKQPHVPPGQANKQPASVHVEKNRTPASSPFSPRIVSPSVPSAPGAPQTPPTVPAPTREISKPHPADNRVDKGRELTVPATIPGKAQGHDKRVVPSVNTAQPPPVRQVFTAPAQPQPAPPAVKPSVPQPTPKVQQAPVIHHNNSAKKVEIPRQAAPTVRVEQRPQPAASSWNASSSGESRSFSSRSVPATPAPAPVASARPTASPITFQNSPAPAAPPVRQHVPSQAPATVIARPAAQPSARPSAQVVSPSAPAIRHPTPAPVQVQPATPQAGPSHGAAAGWNTKGGSAGGPPGQAKKEKK